MITPRGWFLTVSKVEKNATKCFLFIFIYDCLDKVLCYSFALCNEVHYHTSEVLNSTDFIYTNNGSNNCNYNVLKLKLNKKYKLHLQITQKLNCYKYYLGT
jgi:hypothetical protein